MSLFLLKWTLWELSIAVSITHTIIICSSNLCVFPVGAAFLQGLIKLNPRTVWLNNFSAMSVVVMSMCVFGRHSADGFNIAWNKAVSYFENTRLHYENSETDDR